MSGLNPPRINTTDPNQQDISDNSDDHFSSASEGSHSPVPITRVERVDDTARHGEVPGTPAYNLRTQDAVPDEIEIIPEGRRSRSNTAASGTRGRALSGMSGTGSASGSRPQTPGGSLIPKTVVEKVDFKPSHGEVEGTPAREMRMADAIPDEVIAAPPETAKPLDGRHQQGVDQPDESEEGRQAWFRSMWEDDVPTATHEPKATENGNDLQENDDHDQEGNDDDFGDDFDDFAEGGGDDADFGDFDEAEDAPPQPQQATSTISSASDILAGLPPLDFTDLSADEITTVIKPYINAILPNSNPVDSMPPASNQERPQPFLSDRSLSLWQQLVSPPPMQPPNWTRSRIRRLFLVSLGVPVDLDEILPPSKQKRLVLPSIGLDSTTSPRPSTTIDRLKDAPGNDSTTSLDSRTGAPKPRRPRGPAQKGPPPPPDFDANAAALLAATTDEALHVYSDGELKDHVFTLGVLNESASRVLEYWLERRDEGLKEKEALEGVIENLVGFVKGRRKG